MPGRPPVIVADSTISLPAGILRGLSLLVVPLEIHHQGQVYHDSVDITPTEFYRLQAAESPLPTTSAPAPGAFLNAFEQAAAATDEVVCITLSATLSAVHGSALAAQREAAATLPGLRIHVVDSRTAGTAEGLIALDAARHAASGGSTAEVLATIERRIADVWLLGYLESLHYLWRGGRIPRLAMWAGRLLDLKPILQLSAGSIGAVERPRTRRRAMDRLVALSSERLGGRPSRAAVIHADAPEQAAELAERIEREIAPVELFSSELTPVIGSHTGPGLVGCALHPVD